MEKGGNCIQSYNELAQSVKFTFKGTKVILSDNDPNLEFIGRGRSAFAFRITNTNKVLKVFFSPFIHIAKEEAKIYKYLHRNPFYPVLYEFGPNYLVIDYIEGNTLYTCLLKGITITSDHIKQIDNALMQSRENGLNPSDIHLRNIFITPKGNIKIIDVARFRQTGTCLQWNDLKVAYYKYYKQKLFPKRIPEFLLNLVAYLYKKNLLQLFLKSPTKYQQESIQSDR